MLGKETLQQKVRRLYRARAEGGWQEGTSLEFKLAGGGLPNKELRRTYSAFANTSGGLLLLGVADDGSIEGVPNIERRLKELTDLLNNSQQVSCNLCSQSGCIAVIEIAGKQIIAVDVPIAEPNLQPVHLNQDEKMSYMRRHEADVCCSEQEIARMRRNRDVCLMGQYSLDGYIVKDSTLEDINLETLGKFRNYMRGTALGKLWQHDDDETLLRHLQAYRTDRGTGECGVTLAGLLMFGKHDSIVELWPSFQLDYFEYEENSDINARWIDRVTNDGTWAGNLYEFFFLVYTRLQISLKKPFVLNQDMTRRDETPAHIALREALVNAIVHADYWVDAGIRIIKRPNEFEFINPGTLLVNKETLFGTEEQISICRNKNLQRMFQALGIVDKAGSGVEKIAGGWLETIAAVPQVSERQDPYRVVWSLPRVGIISRERMETIIRCVGQDVFEGLSAFEKLVLVCIPPDEPVSHSNILERLPMHPADLSRFLARCVDRGYLTTSGRTRAVKYSWVAREKSSKALPTNGTPSDCSREVPESVKRVKQARRSQLEDIEQAILDICLETWVTLSELVHLLDRNRKTLKRILQPMIHHQLVEERYPQQSRHPEQAYRTVSGASVPIKGAETPLRRGLTSR